MASFTVDLTPSLVTPSSEGSLDTTVVNGLSKQRTFEMTMVVNSSNGRKIVGRLADGSTYNDNVVTVTNTNQAGHPTSGDSLSGSTV